MVGSYASSPPTPGPTSDEGNPRAPWDPSPKLITAVLVLIHLRSLLLELLKNDLLKDATRSIAAGGDALAHAAQNRTRSSLSSKEIIRIRCRFSKRAGPRRTSIGNLLSLDQGRFYH